MKKFIFLFSFLFYLSGYAQHWAWDSIIPTAGQLRIVKNHVDEVFTFEFQGSELKKYNPAGKFLWAKSFNGSLFNVSFDLANNIYITGTFSNSLTVDSVTLISKGDDDIFFAKLTPGQNMVWLHQVGSIGKDVAGDINVKGNKIFLSGGTRDTTWFDQVLFPKKACLDLFIAGFDMNANPEKIKFAEQPVPDQYYGSIGCELENDASGNVIALAAITGQVKIDTTIINDGYAYYLLKFDTALNLVWNRNVTSGLGCGAGCLRLNSTDDILLIVNNAAHYFQAGYVRRFSADGATMQTFFSENMGFIYGLDLDSSDNIYFTGMRNQWTYSGNPPEEHFFRTGKLSPAGNLTWLIQDSSLSYREGSGIAALSNASLFISGRFADKIVLKDTLVTSPGVTGFLAILDVNAATLVKGLFAGQRGRLEIFPNPCSGIFTAHLFNCPNAKLYITDITGNCLWSQDCRNNKSTEIDLTNQSKGIYFLELVSDNERVVKKIILE